MDLKARLYKLRSDKAYSVAFLSKKSGVAASYIQRIENGERKPTVDIMAKLCKGLGITLADFFNEDSANISADMLEFITKVKMLSPEQIRAFNVILSLMVKDVSDIKKENGKES